MLSKSQIQTIASLQHKKFRREHGLFVVEGIKSVMEFYHSDYSVKHIFYTAQAAAKLIKFLGNIKSEKSAGSSPLAATDVAGLLNGTNCEEVSDNDLGRISSLKTPQGILAVVRIPTYPPLTENILRHAFHLVLDDIQDPGNLGTIIRTAEWFGFKRIICSMGTVDAYNPKVVQASMGSLARMQVIPTDIMDLLTSTTMPVFGAVLDGTPIYNAQFGTEGFIVLGNEGNGICPAVLPHIKHHITIPRVGKAESLNVAISAALFCAEVARMAN